MWKTPKVSISTKFTQNHVTFEGSTVPIIDIQGCKGQNCQCSVKRVNLTKTNAKGAQKKQESSINSPSSRLRGYGIRKPVIPYPENNLNYEAL